MKIKTTVMDAPQGSPAWIAHRTNSLNASELAIVMGLSKYKTRAQLLAEKATGVAPEVDAETQRRFDKGHEYEAIARPWGEEIVGDMLYPTVLSAEVEGLSRPLSASLDGQDLMPDHTWEHKTGRADLLASLEAGVIPEEYHPQMEQGLMLSGASRCLFMASNGTRESMRFAWYESNPELRAQIIPTWRQFEADLAAYVPPEVAPPAPPGRAPETLPALRIEVTGAVTASNLDAFKQHALGVFKGINRELKTDSDFANAEQTVKWCGDVEERLAAAKQHALSQTESIEALFRTIDDISAEARRVRLDLDKLVKARKEAIRGEIVAEGVTALRAHIDSLSARLGHPYMPMVHADFGAAIKGKKNLDSMRDAVATTLANAKIEANRIADTIDANLKAIAAADAPHLFTDLRTLVLKQADDLAAVIAQRLAAEQQRQEAERERIRQQEAARVEREHQAQVQREREAQAAAERAAQAAAAAAEAARKPEPVAALAVAPAVARASVPLPPAPAPTPAAPAQLPADAELIEGIPCLKLGSITRRFDGLNFTADYIGTVLGVPHFTKVKAATYWRLSDFPSICNALAAKCAGMTNTNA